MLGVPRTIVSLTRVDVIMLIYAILHRFMRKKFMYLVGAAGGRGETKKHQKNCMLCGKREITEKHPESKLIYLDFRIKQT